MGPTVDQGETLQLLVGTGVWKKSKLLDEDMLVVGTLSLPRAFSMSFNSVLII